MPIKLSPARYAGRLAPSFQVFADLVHPIAPPPLDSLGAIAFDTAQGISLYEKAADTIQAESIASLVKIMVAWIVYRLKGPDGDDVLLTEQVAITADDVTYGVSSRTGLSAGDTFTWDEMLWFLLHGADTVAAACAGRVLGGELVSGGGRAEFISYMNSLAAGLGMANTTFTTVDGQNLTTDRSTPRDVMLMVRTVWWYDNKVLRAYSAEASHTYTISAGPGAPSLGPDTNPIDLLEPIKDYGIVCARGGALPSVPTFHTVSVWTAENGNELIIVTMNADTDGNRYLDHRAIYLEIQDDFPYLLEGFAVGTDAAWSNVKLMAGFDSAIADESDVGRTLTAVGDAARDLTNPLVGVADLAGDGIGDYVYGDDAADLEPGAVDFSVDLYFRGSGTDPAAFSTFVSKWNALANERTWMIQWNGSTDALGGFISLNGTAAIFAEKIVTASPVSVEAAVLFNGAKRHLRFERVGTTIYLYLNGVLIASTGSAGGALHANTSRPMILARNDGGGTTGAHLQDGNIDEVRVTIGSSRSAGAAKFQINGRVVPRSGP